MLLPHLSVIKCERSIENVSLDRRRYVFEYKAKRENVPLERNSVCLVYKTRRAQERKREKLQRELNGLRMDNRYCQKIT